MNEIIFGTIYTLNTVTQKVKKNIFWIIFRSKDFHKHYKKFFSHVKPKEV